MSAFAIAIGGKADMAFLHCICLLLTQSGHGPRVQGSQPPRWLPLFGDIISMGIISRTGGVIMIPNWLSKFSALLPRVAGLAAIVSLSTAISSWPTHAQSGAGQITVLYDAFGKTSTMKKDWGFSALIEYGGKRILFDTGNNADIFAHNVEAKGVDLRQLDFAVVSHRHGDHTSGLNHLLKVNPAVKIYAPQENFGVFGAALPSTFYRRNDSLSSDMRYFDGKPPETLRFGSPWPEGNFTWITKTTEVAPGLHLILLQELGVPTW